MLFHAGLKAQTPVAGVLTLADKFMLGLYAVIGVSFLVSALMLSLHFGGHSEQPNLPRGSVPAKYGMVPPLPILTTRHP